MTLRRRGGRGQATRGLGLSLAFLLLALPGRTAGGDDPVPLLVVHARPAPAGTPTRTLPMWLLSPAGPILRAGEQAPEGGALDDLEEAASVPGAATGERGLGLAVSFGDRAAADLRTVLGRGEDWHVADWRASAASSALATRLHASGQLPYLPSARDRSWPDSDAAPPAAIVLEGEVVEFELGAEYRAAGRRLERVLAAPAAWRDREGGEVWLARRVGPLRLRLAHLERTDNVDRNPSLPRTTRAETLVGSELALTPWPTLRLMWGTGSARRVWLGRSGLARRLERQEVERAGAGVGWAGHGGGAAWSLDLDTTVATSRDALRPGRETATVHHDLSFTLRWADVTVAPAVSAARDRQRWSDGGTAETIAGSVGVSLDPRGSRWRVWSALAGVRTRGEAGGPETDGVSVSAGLARDLGDVLPRGSTLSVEAGWDRHAERTAPGAVWQGAYGFVLLTVAAF